MEIFSSVESYIEEITCEEVEPCKSRPKVIYLKDFLKSGLAPSTFHFFKIYILQTPSEMELAELKENVIQLESSLVEKQNEILFLEEEVRSLRLKLAKRDAELMKQDRELNKLRVRRLIRSFPFSEG